MKLQEHIEIIKQAIDSITALEYALRHHLYSHMSEKEYSEYLGGEVKDVLKNLKELIK